MDSARVQGQTSGGGQILGDPDPGTEALIWVRVGDVTWAYGLIGGP